MGPRSPLRYGRCRTDVPRTSCNPSSARLRLLWGRPHGSKVSTPLRSLQSRRPPDVLQPIFRKASVVAGQAPMVQGLASGSVGSWHEVPRTSLGLRSATVVAEQTSPGRLATHLPQDYGRGRAGPMGPRSPLRFGRRRADVPRTSCNPSTARLRLW